MKTMKLNGLESLHLLKSITSMVSFLYFNVLLLWISMMLQIINLINKPVNLNFKNMDDIPILIRAILSLYHKHFILFHLILFRLNILHSCHHFTSYTTFLLICSYDISQACFYFLPNPFNHHFRWSYSVLPRTLLKLFIWEHLCCFQFYLFL